MTGLEATTVVLAGMGAGCINAVIGSGSLITFPTLLAVGLPPVTANVTSNIGLVPGSLSGVIGYRRELRGQGRRARTLAVASGLGGLTGALLLLRLDDDVFDAVVPALVLLACALMVVQPRLAAWVASRRSPAGRDVGGVPLALGFAAGIYGGYFGAAQGVILLAMLSVLVPDEMRRSNALKNVLAGTVNLVAALVFIVYADVRWDAVALVAAGAVVGGAAGARVGRRIPAIALRALVVLLGTAVAFRLLLT